MKASKTEIYPPARTNGLKTRTELLLHDTEPEAYFTDEHLFTEMVGVHNIALKHFQGFANDYQCLGFGPANLEIVQRISSGDLAEIEKRFYNDVEVNLAKLGMTNQNVLDKLRNGTDTPLLKFKQNTASNIESIERIKKMFSPNIRLSVANYSFTKDGNILFSEADTLKMKKEHCQTFVNNSVQKEFIGLVESTLQQLTEIKSILNRNGLRYMWGYNNLFSIEENGQEQTLVYNKKIITNINK